MRRWIYMLGGLLVWAVHFVGVYAIASLADVVARADDFGWRMAGLGFSVLCAAACAGLLVEAVARLRRTEEGAFDARALSVQLAALGAGVALVAVIWQALPTVIGY